MSGMKDKLKSTWVENGDWLNGIALAFIFVLVAATLAIQHRTLPGFELTAPGWVGVSAMVIAAYLSISFARGAKLWREFKDGLNGQKLERDKPNPFSELFGYLIFALLASAAVAIYLSYNIWNPNQLLDATTIDWPVIALLGALAAIFSPPLYWFMRLARETYGEDYDPDHISKASVGIGFVIVFLIFLLASAAGSGAIPHENDFFGVYILGFVLFMFLLFIFVPYFQFWKQRAEQDGQIAASGFTVKNPARAISAFDGFLVRSIAPLTGATQHQEVKFSFLPHLLLVAIFLPLTVLGYALPAPFGLVPIGMAALLAISLGRRWSWVEDDRETAMRIHKLKDKNIRIGFLNDLRDEALLGYAFLFLLVPLALRQLQMSFGLFTGGRAGDLMEWVQFFGIELAKGVPIVDWADIYGVSPEAPFEHRDDSSLSRHLVFGSRLIVDIVIIAALLQAWGIVRRNADQMKLFKDGQLDMLDPFTEKAWFQNGAYRDNDNRPRLKSKLKELLKVQAEKTQKRGLGRIPYNLDRLGDIQAKGNENDRLVVAAIIEEYEDVLVGPVTTRLESLLARWQSQTKSLKDGSDWAEEQRLVLERLLNKGFDQKINLNPDEMKVIRSLVALVSKYSAFYNAKLMAFKWLSRNKKEAALFALMAGLFDGEGFKSAGLSDNFVELPSWGLAREPHQETREKIVTYIDYLYSGEKQFNQPRYGASESLKKMCVEILLWVADEANGEAQMPKAAARKALKKIKLT